MTMARLLPIAPAAVPTLAELAVDPARAAGLPPAVLQALLCQCATVQTVLLGTLVAAGTTAGQTVPDAPDSLLDVAAAAERLSTSTDWLYRHARQLPFTIHNGRQLRFSARGIERYIRERRGLPY
jgi:hypothetical protein